jgi:hypothetical protein
VSRPLLSLQDPRRCTSPALVGPNNLSGYRSREHDAGVSHSSRRVSGAPWPRTQSRHRSTRLQAELASIPTCGWSSSTCLGSSAQVRPNKGVRSARADFPSNRTDVSSRVTLHSRSLKTPRFSHLAISPFSSLIFARYPVYLMQAAQAVQEREKIDLQGSTGVRTATGREPAASIGGGGLSSCGEVRTGAACKGDRRSRADFLYSTCSRRDGCARSSLVAAKQVKPEPVNFIARRANNTAEFGHTNSHFTRGLEVNSAHWATRTTEGRRT